MRSRLKICGLTRYDDAELAVELGAWGLGFILWPHSKRFVTVKQAADIVARLALCKKLPEKLVGVFVDASKSEIDEAVNEIGLTSVQLHGDESPEFVAQLPYETIKALRPVNDDDIEKAKDYAADFLLVDAKVGNAYGGTGQLADWSLARKIKAFAPLILSGGLNSQNILDAQKTLQPFAFDLSSGVEASYGIKSGKKLRELFSKL